MIEQMRNRQIRFFAGHRDSGLLAAVVLAILLVLSMGLPVAQAVEGAPVSGAQSERLPVLRLDDTPRIAVISAFEPELTMLVQNVQQPRHHRINGVQFTTGTLRGQPVLLFLSGISMVNAAMNTQLALDRFHVTHVLFSGIAGSASTALHIGDVSVPQRWAQHLEVWMAREDGQGGYLPPQDDASWNVPAFGMLHHRQIGMAVPGQSEPRQQFWFDVDAGMLQVARQLQGIPLQTCDAQKTCLRSTPRLLVGGHGVSGPAFVDNARYREHLARHFEASVIDMESAACAMVAQANGVPFLAFRSVSDLAGGGDGANEMETFLNLAATNSATVVLAFLERWGQADDADRPNATDTDMSADIAPAALSPREQAGQAAHGDNRGLTPASAWQP